jgi:hypothetical protein
MSPALQNKLKLWLGILFAVVSAVAGTRQVGDGMNWSEDLVPLAGEGGALLASLWAVFSGQAGLHSAAPPAQPKADLSGKLDIATRALVQAVADKNKPARDAALDLLDAFSLMGTEPPKP